jgi:hypothetical protein
MKVPERSQIYDAMLQSDEVRRGLRACSGQLAKDLGRIREAIFRVRRETHINMADLSEGNRRFKAELPELLRTIAEHGWFISGYHTPLAAIHPLAQMFRTGDIERANEQLCGQVKPNLPAIEGMLIKEFPRRGAILERAFRSLREKDYVVCIPLLLIQADGIGREIIAAATPKFSITSKQRKAQQVIKDFIAKSANGPPFTGEIFELITHDIPLTRSEGHQGLKPGVLNRHGILHGLDTDYATEANALRAVSWIDYVSYFAGVA